MDNNIPKTFDSFDFNRVKLLNQNKKMIPPITIMNPWNYKYIVFWGKQGVGKTHLAKAIMNKYYEIQKDEFHHWYSGDRRDKLDSFIQFYDSQEIYRLFFEMQPHHDNHQNALFDYRYILRSNLLVIDDVGTEKATEAEIFQQGFKKLLDDYHEMLIVTTNLSISDFQLRYKMKILSRLSENSLFVFMIGSDFRQKYLLEAQNENQKKV